MRWALVGVSCLVLAACSKAPQEPPPDRAAALTDTAPAAEAISAPGIAVSAAPGVAFTYAYAFRLPAERVSATQEVHAQACEKLGIARCRITGMHFRLLGENAVEGTLSFKLDPAIARGFGKAGIDAVQRADGTLIDADIAGTDAGAAIAQLTQQRARAAEELRHIDAELAKPGRSASERAELQNQRADLVRQLAGAADATAAERESLATTPMTFTYSSGPAIRGFDASAPIKSAGDLFVSSAQITLTFVLGALALLGPPALLAVLAWLAWRRLRRPRVATIDEGAPPTS